MRAFLLGSVEFEIIELVQSLTMLSVMICVDFLIRWFSISDIKEKYSLNWIG